MMIFVRYALPLLIIAAGVVAMAIVGPEDERYVGGGAIIGAGLAVALLNLFYRMSVSAEQDRDDEEAAREYFDRHGRWPDDDA